MTSSFGIAPARLEAEARGDVGAGAEGEGASGGPPRALGPLERAFLALVQAASELSAGYSVSFAEEVVRQHGIRGFVRWARACQAGFDALVEAFGERDAHLLAAFASFWSGCDYCAYGHLLAHNLHVFADEGGALFPLDELEVPALIRARDPQLLSLVSERLGAPAHARVRRLVERQAALRLGQAVPQEGPQGEEDRLLAHANALYDWVSNCSTAAEAPSPPLGRIARARRLRAAYAAAREAWRAGRRPSR